jgi:hypothetical protein
MACVRPRWTPCARPRSRSTTAESLKATLESMQSVEEMRRDLRDLRDASKLDAN